jgi:hypothetical protein
MNQTTWAKAVEIVRPHVVRIGTPQGTGSGFLLSNGKNNSICAIATAAHVVAHAHYWEEPIRIEHVSSGKFSVIRRQERAVLIDSDRDTAAVIFDRGDLPLPKEPLKLGPKGMSLKVGNEIGWLGFPAIPLANLCFFAGNISAWVEEQNCYLVDGVAINGVSGGPAIYRPIYEGQNDVVVMGVVSAYMPNRATGEALPGLSVVRDIEQFHELAPTFASLDQAKSAESPAEPPASMPDRKSE